MDLQEAFDAGFDAVRGYVDRSFASFEERITRLEARAPERGEKGEQGGKGDTGDKGLDGAAGKKGDPGDAGIRGEQGAAGERGEKGEQGTPGLNGRDADPEVIASMVADEVAKAVSSIVIPKGEKGDVGERGDVGTNGADADPMLIEALVDERVSKRVSEAVSAIVVPKGEAGPPGVRGEKGDVGPSGVSLAGALINRDGNLTLTLSDGSTRDLGIVVGSDGKDGIDGIGKDGADGRDGFGFDDMEERLEDEGRTIVRVYRRGTETKEFRHQVPQVIDRGVWKEGQEYAQGDGATWAGSWFIAQRATKDKPETPDCGWRLAVKRGRDGKPGKDGIDGKHGLPGKDGAPGRTW